MSDNRVTPEGLRGGRMDPRVQAIVAKLDAVLAISRALRAKAGR